MRTVSVSHLKAQLSRQLRRVKGGEQLLVTERGRPIAVLAPFSAPDSELKALAEAGLIRPARRRLEDDFWRLPWPQDAEAGVRAALREEREEGW